MKQSFNRKEFLISATKTSCALLVGASVASQLESCSSIKVIKTQASEKGVVVVDVNAFATQPTQIIRVEQLAYDILVTKKSETEYLAVLMRCTHQDWALTANTKGLNCSLHGSAFDAEGKVTNGPATEALKKFKTELKDQQLYIS